MRKDDVEGKYLGVQQNKTRKKLRIQMTDGDEPNSLGLLIGKMAERNTQHICSYLIVSARGKRMTAKMLRDRWPRRRRCEPTLGAHQRRHYRARLSTNWRHCQAIEIAPKTVTKLKIRPL